MPGSTRHPSLRVEALVAGYEPGFPIVKEASLEITQGEILAILGPNGAGKSTLVKAIAGLVPITSGRVLLEGRDITHTPAHKLGALGLGYVPQTENVFTNLTIAENLELAAALQKVPARTRLPELYDLFPDLARQRKLLASRLSGGQRQMLAVARALVRVPHLLMLDEPSAGLSPRLVLEVFEKLREIRATGVTIVLVEQNVKAALAVADRAAVLVDGRERVVAPSAELANDARIADLYLGKHSSALTRPGNGSAGAPAP
jgi:branched-chain amino acid transport system ATP-binding protein